MASYSKEAAKGKISVLNAFQKGIVSLKEQGIHLMGTPLPKFKAKKASMYRQRNRFLKVTKLCHKSVEKVQVPDMFTKHLLADYNDNGVRILIFCHEEIAPTLSEGHYFMDGTFFSCPVPFGQLLSIHLDKSSDMNVTNVVPVIYVLLSDKKLATYLILFDLLKTVLPYFQPTKITVDFERATITAIKQKLPNTVIVGCYFHFVKCLQKKGKATGLNKSPDTNYILQLSCRLPLLPINLIREGWNYIVNEMGNSDPERKFKKYVEKYWLKNNFEAIWCVFAERHRTNNAVEAWNRMINRKVPKNVNIVQLLHILFEDFQYDADERKRKRDLITKDMKILEAQIQLMNGLLTPGHFLTKMALLYSNYK